MTKPAALLLTLLLVSAPLRAAVVVTPAAVKLDSPEASQQLLVTPAEGDGTRAAKYESANPAIAAVDTTGMVTPKGEGKTEIVVKLGADAVRVPVEVAGLKSPRPVSFEREVIPILTKASCNSGGCHGKAEGQAGFKLSVFGFDPDADYAGVGDRRARGRRLFPAAPESSLLLMKATGRHAARRGQEDSTSRHAAEVPPFVALAGRRGPNPFGGAKSSPVDESGSGAGPAHAGPRRRRSNCG